MPSHYCCSGCTENAAAAVAVAAYSYPDTVSSMTVNVDFDKAMTHWIVSNLVVARKAMSVIDMGNFPIDTVSAGFDKAMSDSIRPMNCNPNLGTWAAYIDHNTMGFSY